MLFPVIKAFTHEGRAFAAGDTIELSALQAAVLHRRGFVSLTKMGYQTASLEVPTTRKRTRNSYRRRDLQAETIE